MLSLRPRRGAFYALLHHSILLAIVVAVYATLGTAGSASAAGVEDPSVFAGNPALLNRAPLNPPPGVAVPPAWFPPTPAGWPGELRDPRDTAPYLAFHKAALMKRLEGTREEPDPAEALYDARYYSLEINLNPTTRILTGQVTMRATVTAGPLSQLTMDLANNMTVSGVTSGGHPATFTHANNLLRVNLDRPYNNQETVTLVTQYFGNPAGDAFGWSTIDGHPMIWTLSEAFAARTWWPCKDYPDDKADSVDVRVTVPTGLITASNGTLREQTDNGITAFSWWHEKHPITTYLVSLASHTYHVYSDWYRYSPTDSMEIHFYNFQSSYPGVQPVQAKVKDMIAAYAARWGEYPFLDEKYGHAEFVWGGGMEHQTCTSLGYFGESVVAHELGHQWWGDMITCETFHDVWLNEGFATFCEAIWAEAEYGHDAYMDEMLLAQYFGPGTIYVPDLSDWNRIFDSNLSYNKPSWVLHMLRGMMGDTTFFQFLRNYYNQYKYSVASTEDLEAVAEATSGLDLHAFFQEWIHGEYYPVYQYDWTSTPAGGGYDISLNVHQLQTWQLFTMPIEVVITTQVGQQSFRIQNSQSVQNYILHVDDQPTEVALDPNHWILRQVLAPIPQPTFERNLLLVNGVDWGTYGTELTSAYQDRAFWGSYNIDFWDCFPAPSGGYPSTLPAPRGHGTIPGDILGQYKTVIWVGNNYGGDLTNWSDTPVYSYLVAGGNVLLMTRMADSYLSDPFRAYLGVTWAGNGTVNDCIATYPGLTNIGRTGAQNSVAGFTLTIGPESTLLYKAVSGHTPNWGLGVIRQPAGGGTYNPNGAKFLLLNGRPYRWVHADLRTNVEHMLGTFLLPDVNGVGAGGGFRFSLSDATPNPFTSETRLRFALPQDGTADLTIWDVNGRRVINLWNGRGAAGEHVIGWDGRDQNGHPVASGIYYVRLQSGGRSAEEKVLRLR
jgi:hypothetical protein